MDFPTTPQQPMQPAQPATPQPTPQAVSQPQPMASAPSLTDIAAGPAPAVAPMPAPVAAPVTPPVTTAAPVTLPTTLPNVAPIPVSTDMSSMAPNSAPIPVTQAGGGGNDIHTMPEKFLNPSAPGGGDGKPHKQKSKAITIILIVVIALAVVSIVGGVAYYLLRGVPTNDPVTTVVVEDDNANEGLNENANANENSNVNENENVNEAANENDNSNDNANENANENSNDNANVSADENANTNETVTNDNGNTNTAADVTTSKDTDKDGLTNEEEKIFGTKADLPDTDTDGYTDGEEILAGYDPTNAASAGRLADNAELVSTYASKKHGYNVVYPAQWIAEEVPEAGVSEILFTPTTLDNAGQFVSITLESNTSGLTALDWYVEQSGASEESVQTITTFSDVEGVLSTDGYTAYFAENGYIYVISYRYGNSPEVHFTTTFTVMLNSLVFTEVKANTTTTTTTTTDTDTTDTTNTEE